jgi:hypothetical protein
MIFFFCNIKKKLINFYVINLYRFYIYDDEVAIIRINGLEGS